MEFKAFSEIKNISKAEMSITQKIHGTNAHILIEEVKTPVGQSSTLDTLEEVQALYPGKKIELAPFSDDTNTVLEVKTEVRAASRTRFIYPGDDNYGFAQYVESNKAEIIEKLGFGRHDGEWAGPGINSGEGLSQKTFVLFNYWEYPPERPLPPQMVVVPLLYKGKLDTNKVEEVMADLKTNGSKLAPGFMRPEGVVITVMGGRLKRVFEAEETQWKKPSGVKAEKVAGPDVSHLLQPVRMEKLLSRDEKYVRDYPKSLPVLCSDYVADLVKEGQIVGDEDQIAAQRKALGSQLFAFAKEMVKKATGEV